jgi:hypothetical protein
VDNRRFIIETGLIFIALSIITAIVRGVVPELHQLVRFAISVGIVVVLWFVARSVWERHARSD